MATTDDLKVTCPVCGYDVGTKEDGTKIKAHKVGGTKCDGSDTLLSEEIESTGVAAGESFEDAPQSDENASQDDEQASNEENSGDDSSESERGTHGVASSEPVVFTHHMRVSNPCPYLHHADWHQANGRLVEVLAKKAGHVPTGEAQFRGMNDGGEHLYLIYTIPVK